MSTSTVTALPEKEIQILRQRAQNLATVIVNSDAKGLTQRYVVVLCGGERLAISAERLSELAPLPDVLPLPGVPSWILGIAQIRGEIFSVVDLAVLWGGSPDAGARMLALTHSGEGRIGFLLRSVEGFRDFYEQDLANLQAAGSDTDRPIRGVTGDLISIVDIDKLLQDPRLTVGASALTPKE